MEKISHIACEALQHIQLELQFLVREIIPWTEQKEKKKHNVKQVTKNNKDPYVARIIKVNKSWC